MKNLRALFLSLMLLFTLGACSADDGGYSSSSDPFLPSQSLSVSDQSQQEDPDQSQTEEPDSSHQAQSSIVEFTPPVEEGEFYYDLENVILYVEYYGCLPDNYITKDDARSLGWNGGTPERYLEGAAIGGDRFGNREGLLPTEKGRTYTECDLNTNGKQSRGAERLVFSSDGLYFYTEDHYEHFTEYYVTEDWEVEEW